MKFSYKILSKYDALFLVSHLRIFDRIQNKCECNFFGQNNCRMKWQKRQLSRKCGEIFNCHGFPTTFPGLLTPNWMKIY